MDAVLPLIGVVIGAVLGGGITFLLDRRREKRAARASLRLVVLELQRTQLTWQRITKAWDEEPTAETADWLVSDLKSRRFATAQWTSYQEVLASTLSDDDWKALTDTYSLIGLVDGAAQEAGAEEASSEDRMELPGLMKVSQWRLDQTIERLGRGAGPLGDFDFNEIGDGPA